MKFRPVKILSTLLISGVCLSAGSTLSFAERDIGSGGLARVCFIHRAIKDRVKWELESNRKEEEAARKKGLPLPTQKNDPFANERVINDVKNVELLDLYYARRSGFPKPENRVIQSRDTFENIITNRMSLIERSGAFSIQLKKWAEAVPFQNWEGSPAVLPDTNDSGRLNIETEDCLWVQLARRYRLENQWRVEVDMRLFPKMDVVDQAALPFHEWIYYGASLMGHQSSLAVHKILRMIFDRDFESLAENELGRLAQELRVIHPPSPSCPGAPVNVSQEVNFSTIAGKVPSESVHLLALVSKFEDGEIEKIDTYADSLVPITVNLWGDQTIQGFPLANKTAAAFYPSGWLMVARLATTHKPWAAIAGLQSVTCLKNQNIYLQDRTVAEPTSPTVLGCYVEEFQHPAYEGLLALKGYTAISPKDRKISSAQLAEDFQTPEGLCRTNQRISFDSQDRILKCE